MELYRFALTKQVVTAGKLIAALDLPPETVRDGLATLLDIGLLAPVEGDAGWFVAVDPNMVTAEVVGPVERAIWQQRMDAAQARERLSTLIPLYGGQDKVGAESTRMERIEDLDDVRGVIAGFAANCREEVLTSQPGGGRREEVLEEAIGRDEQMLRRGVRMRTLYQHTARFSPGTRAYVERVTELGADVRTVDDQIMRLLVFDRKVAVISVRDSVNGAVIIHDRDLVHFLVNTFELVWAAAQPFPLSWNNGELAEIGDELKLKIFRLLSEGLTDQVIAKRMGMSVRTCRRHIAEVMSRLEAETRFRAGYLLGSRGWQAAARIGTAAETTAQKDTAG
ncbi:helix-turn-helix domain-containing protein [Streptomyces sp. NPDC096132]|uniref:helix-turn-helix domain-containing protein n=1 Tax=Streptomyces sp. NPDC096132 TaxID=3366075 RepID=UPI00380A0D15